MANLFPIVPSDLTPRVRIKDASDGSEFEADVKSMSDSEFIVMDDQTPIFFNYRTGFSRVGRWQVIALLEE